MNSQSHKLKIKLIKKALNSFPSILKQKEKIYKEKKEILKRFMPLARKLKKMMDENKK